MHTSSVPSPAPCAPPSTSFPVASSPAPVSPPPSPSASSAPPVAALLPSPSSSPSVRSPPAPSLPSSLLDPIVRLIQYTRTRALPNGWKHIQSLDLAQEFTIHVATLRNVPQCIRDHYGRIQTQILENICSSYERNLDDQLELAWKLFLLLPRLLLYPSQRGGTAGTRNLKARIQLFDEGRWDLLLERAHSTVRGHIDAPHIRSDEEEAASRLSRADYLISIGELSHAARELRSSGRAPGTQATLNELRDPALRPPQPVRPVPENILQFRPSSPVQLDRTIFDQVILSLRKGKSAACGGTRNEYLKLCLEDDYSFSLLYEVSQ